MPHLHKAPNRYLSKGAPTTLPLACLQRARLNRQFDAVVIPDSIDYMTSEDELRQAIQTAAVHLKPGGVLLVVAKTAETFQNNNFAYTREKDGVQVMLFENNCINPFSQAYETTFVYLIRRHGELFIHTDYHVPGLFPQATWERLFTEAGFFMQQTILPGSYDNYLLGQDDYPLAIFCGQKAGTSR